MDNKQHITACKELMQDAASRINLKVELKEYKEGKIEGVEILLKNKEGYQIYKSYDNVSQILGFIDGLQYINSNNKGA